MSWDDLIEMFNPGHKDLAEERDRKRIEAQLPGSEADDDAHAAGVDLERGIILLPKAEEHPEGDLPTRIRGLTDLPHSLGG